MTTPTPESVKALADGLTKAQLEAMEWADTTWFNPIFNTKSSFHLYRKGVFDRRMQHNSDRPVQYRLNDLGQQVAAALRARAAHLGASHA